MRNTVKRVFQAGMFIAVLMMVSSGVAQTKATPARYFQLTLNLKFGANEQQQETAQTITTEVAVRGTVPGACRARMVSQTPTGSGAGTKYIEVGTKFDADDIHVDGDSVALHFVLSASRPVKMIKYKSKEGVEVEEPVITERVVELSVKIPLDTTKTVFDSSSKSLIPGKRPVSDLKDDPAVVAAAAAGVMSSPDQPVLIEMIVTELK
jgi:hypothetical protein